MFHSLELPWGVQHPDVQYWKKDKIHIYKGPILPASLRKYSSPDFSYSRWKEDELNGMVLPPEQSTIKFTPRDHQKIAAKKIFKSYYEGWRGFLMADKTGLGKTLSTLAGITVIAKKEGFTPRKRAKTLIVCPKGAIPQWRSTLHHYPIATAIHRPLIINYEQLNKLLVTPPNARVVKRTRTKNRQTAMHGVPTIDWDYIIFDEAHYLKNYPKSTSSMAAANIAKLNKPYKRGYTPFVIYSTATPGASPLNFALMAGWLARLISREPEARKVTPKTWGSFLEQQGFAVKKGKTGYNWGMIPWYGKDSDDPKERRKYALAEKKAKAEQRRDARIIGKALTSPSAPFIMRSPKDIADWPEQQAIPMPLELSPRQQPIYEEAWSRFRDWLRLTPAKSDPKGALVENLRYRQKSSLLKVESMIETVRDFVDTGHQVYISCEFTETIDKYKELLGSKIRVAEISGRNSKEREEIRVAFQKGEYDVVLCTVVAAISLHQDETLPDGSKASSNPRVTIIHDVRQNNLDTEQALGRAHRDGTNSVAYFPFFERTVDEKVINRHITKTGNMRSMLGSNDAHADELENIFRQAAAKTTPPNRFS